MLWHWLYFLEAAPRGELGEDGHPRKGDFLPPVTNPRRMFAGGRSQILEPLQLGREALLRETILSCEEKSGRSGAITLITVGYEYFQEQRLHVREERDFIYLPARPGPPSEALHQGEPEPVEEAPLARDFATDATLLFRFSALTFNGHRIHYDPFYARDAEGYPALVVHGPLTGILLAELVRGAVAPATRFSFRALAPLFSQDLLRLRGQADEASGTYQLIAYRPDGQVAMKAEVKT
jgi:3-methylfumaryl-CoA hydratase